MTTLIPKFDQNATGAINRPINLKFAETISLGDFIPSGTNTSSTDCTAYIQAAINAAANNALYIPAGTYNFTGQLNINSPMMVYGDGYASSLNPVNTGGNTIFVNSSNVTFSNIRLDGSTPGGIALGNTTSISNILFENCYFRSVAQVVWLWTVNNVMVQNCTFDNTGYGVIQQAGYVSNYVTVDNNIAFNMKSDFVEANCTGSAPSGWWTITNNIFEGSTGFPSSATEQRFVGITSVKNVIISNNNVQKANGDAAIHLEDTQGECIIDSNIIDNCLCTGGNNGYIYLLNSAKDVTITNNIFLRTNASLPAAYAFSSSSNIYSNELIFSNNRIVGTSIAGNFGGLALQGGGGIQKIDNNTFYNMTDCIITGLNMISNASITGNIAVGATNFLYCPGVIGATGGGGNNVLVQGNTTSGITGYDITFGENTNGTSPCSNISVLSNVFSKVSLIQDLSNGNTNVVYANNVLSSTASKSFSGATTQQYMNYISSGSTFNAVSVLGNYANDSAAASGGVPIGGMYRNGSVVQIRVS